MSWKIEEIFEENSGEIRLTSWLDDGYTVSNVEYSVMVYQSSDLKPLLASQGKSGMVGKKASQKLGLKMTDRWNGGFPQPGLL